MRVRALSIDPSPEQVVQKSVSLAHADRGQSVTVAGPDRLQAMISLCRDGFNHVTCARDALGAGGEEVSDVLLLAGCRTTDELADVLAHTSRLLRDGGLLVVQLRRPRDDAVVKAVLDSKHMRTTSTVVDLTAGCLVTHTVIRDHAGQRGRS